MDDQYKGFAKLYDLEMSDRETNEMYDYWHRELKKAIIKEKLEVKTIIDLACGTGNTAIPWLKEGYKVIGVDISKDMLKEAKNKSIRVKWYNQDITKLKIKEKGEIVTCLYDALNHILKTEDLKKVFKNTYSVLNEGGLFLFDLNDENFFKWLSGREKLFTIGDNYFVASNEYDPETKIVEFRQLWFIKDGNKYKKKEIKVKERAYSKTEILSLLKEVGFSSIKSWVQSKREGKVSRMVYLAKKS